MQGFIARACALYIYIASYLSVNLNDLEQIVPKLFVHTLMQNCASDTFFDSVVHVDVSGLEHIQ